MEGTPSVAAPEPRRPPSHRLRLVVLGVVVLAALLAITGLLLGHGSGSSGMRTITTTAPARSLAPLGPIAATPAVLTTIAKAAGSPIYWLGAEAGSRTS